MTPDLAYFLENNWLTGFRAYVVALITIISVTVLRVAMNPVLGDSAPYAFQALVLLVIASLAGHGPSLFGLAVAVALGWYTIPPYDQPTGQKVANEVTTTIVGVTICLVTATMRSALITAAAARREADFLGREMTHRVKNLFAVVASMVTLSARDRPDARAVLNELRARVQALSMAHDVAINQTDLVSLPDLMRQLTAPYCRPGSGKPRVIVSGDAESLPAGYTTPLALIFHELATNAVKYGPLGTEEGCVHLSWRRRDDRLEIRWRERGVPRSEQPVEPSEAGFGTVLVDASVAQMQGTIDRELEDEGLAVRISVPFADAERIRFRSAEAGARQEPCTPSRSSLSALRASKWFLRRKPAIRDSRS